MGSVQHFQSDNMKYDKDRTNIFNPEFSPTISAKSKTQTDSLTRNMPKYKDFVSWARFYPDLFLDLITPETGGIRLDLDQRVFLRSLCRFASNYAVFPRGYGKTFVEVLAMYLTAIFHPDIEISMTAQTKENAAKLVEEKHREIVKFYPLIANEISKSSFAKDTAEVNFTSGGRISIMANSQSSKGARRKRLNIEESALLNNELFQDALEPIVNIPRRTIGREALVNPEELNGQINFLTTSGFRGSDEFDRNFNMINEMSDLKGKMVLGADWQLACTYGRGETKSQLLDKKAKLSPIFFAMNYESRWVGAVDSALVDINKLLDTRTLTKPEYKSDGKSEYVLGVDVARSLDTSNNQSSVAVARIKRNKSNKIVSVALVNIINISNALTFTAQAIEIKKIRAEYAAKAVISDSNGLGVSLVDEFLKENVDPNTGEVYPCWDTMNTEQQPEVSGSEKIVYDLKVQGVNSDIIVNFIDYVDSGKLQLIEKKPLMIYDINNGKDTLVNQFPYINTDLFVEQVANLKLKQLPSGKFTIEKATKKINKDHYSSVSYVLWYIKQFEDNIIESDSNALDFLFIN